MLNVKKLVTRTLLSGFVLSQVLSVSPLISNISLFDTVKVNAATFCPDGLTPVNSVNDKFCPDGLTSLKTYDVNGMRIHASSEETVQSNEIASNLLDNNTATSWCTKWDQSDKGQKFITIDLGQTTSINHVRYVPRQNQGLNGVITKYKIAVSNDGVNFKVVAKGNWNLDDSEKFAYFKSTNASFIKLIVVKGNGGWASGSELSFGGVSSPAMASPILKLNCPDGLTPIKPVNNNFCPDGLTPNN